VTEKTVEILTIVSKEEANTWLERVGEPDEDSSVQLSAK
jgi:hypothetical protein